MNNESESIVRKEQDKLIRSLNKIVVWSVRFLAVMIIFVIFWGLLDVVMHVYRQVVASTTSMFTDENLFALLGSFLAVLIAVEIYLNIVFYLKRDAIHVPLVLATALTAVARKVILLDYKIATGAQIGATALVIIALGVTLWLLKNKDEG